MKHGTPRALLFLDEAIAELASRHLLRDRHSPQHGTGSFCSNDYLGLAVRPAPVAASGAGSSRLVAGERPEHVALEEAAAELVGAQQSLVFSSGYAANVGLLSALAGPRDLVVSDVLNHASIIDGIRLSRARAAIVPHLDLGAVESALRGRGSGRAFVVTESYFSMDADSPDLFALRRLCDEHDAALVVDEAHALGVLGPGGRGLCAQADVRADAIVGTFGKAFGASGAFVAGCSSLTHWLWNRARTFVFSTGMSPSGAAAALAGVRVAHLEPDRRQRVLAAAAELRAALADCGVTACGFGHIVPWVLGEAHVALAVAEALQARGMDVRAIRPPSVPPGTARIRLTVTAGHSPADIQRVASAIGATWQRGRPWAAA
ncbi:MAG: aminotransferase class I/II-fold pyridoxal phosphate-dependent enzyme [Polyangiaceae bacterium]